LSYKTIKEPRPWIEKRKYASAKSGMNLKMMRSDHTMGTELGCSTTVGVELTGINISSTLTNVVIAMGGI